jgi:hypothetical protein
MGVMAGSRCPTDLSQVDFNDYDFYTLNFLRKDLGIDKKLLKKCYETEKQFFPKSKESQRLL